jgi:hypothetical protein
MTAKTTTILSVSSRIPPSSPSRVCNSCSAIICRVLGVDGATAEAEKLQSRDDSDALLSFWAAGGSHSMCLDATGTVYTFGDGGSGRLGHGDVENRYTPEVP